MPYSDAVLQLPFNNKSKIETNPLSLARFPNGSPSTFRFTDPSFWSGTLSRPAANENKTTVSKARAHARFVSKPSRKCSRKHSLLRCHVYVIKVTCMHKEVGTTLFTRTWANVSVSLLLSLLVAVKKFCCFKILFVSHKIKFVGGLKVILRMFYLRKCIWLNDYRLRIVIIWNKYDFIKTDEWLITYLYKYKYAI